MYMKCGMIGYRFGGGDGGDGDSGDSGGGRDGDGDGDGCGGPRHLMLGTYIPYLFSHATSEPQTYRGIGT